MPMDLTPLNDLVEETYIRAVNENRYHDALATVVFAYLLARSRQDKEAERQFLGLMQSTVELALHKEHSIDNSECSFCGTQYPAARLFGGQEATICSSCAALANSYFRGELSE
jgi:hypothetical protein